MGICVWDFKGDFWCLLPGVYTEWQGFYEMWMAVISPISVPGYDEIPVPIFTEWWVDPQAEFTWE